MYRFSDRIYLRMYVWYLSGLVLMCCISLFYEGQSSSLTRNTRELVKQEAEDLRYGKNILPEGDLYKCHKLSVSDKKVLDVDTELVKDIYLYGYTGADYENGKWQPLKKSAYGGENSGMTEWLQKNNFAVNNILGTYNSISLKKKKTNSIKIKNIGTDRERLYTTLETVKISGSGYNADKDNGYHASGLRGAKSYSLDEMSSGLPGEMLSVKKWVQEPQNEQQKKYMSSEKIYRNFVYDNYLGVNKELSEYIQKNYVKKAKKSDKTGVYSITRYIRENLKEKTVYDKAPQAYKSGEEPIELFMTGEKAGNSALYASAAVEIFRAFGIPARYAEGFLLKKADIQKAETGNITLTGKNAHAWVQVYMDAAGWVDIDVTPGFYYEERELMHMVDSPEGMQLTAEVRKNTGNSGKKYSGMKKEDKNKNVFSFIVVLKIFVSLLMAVVILFILYLGIKELSKIVRYKKYKIKLKNAAEPQKGWIMYSMLISLLEDVGIDVRLGWRTKETQTRIKKECPSVDDDEFENVAAILEKNIYGEKKLELWEVNQVGEFVDKIYYDVTGIMRKMSFTRK